MIDVIHNKFLRQSLFIIFINSVYKINTNINKTCFYFKSENMFQNLPQIHAKYIFVLLRVRSLRAAKIFDYYWRELEREWRR